MTDPTAAVRLHVDALFRMPDLVGTVPGLAGAAIETGVARMARTGHEQLRAVHHDTEDLRLTRWGASLRRVERGAEPGWHLDLPVDGVTKGEPDQMVLPLAAGGVGDVPTDLADVVTALARRQPLVPVLDVAVDSTSYVLVDAAGDQVAGLTDDAVSIMSGEVVASRFRELRITGTTDAVTQVVAVLSAHGAMATTESQLSAALGPGSHDDPDVPEPAEVTPDDPAGDAVHAHLVTHVRRFLLQDMRVRRDLPDSVHQMRVAARRLRSGLRAFAPLVDAQWSRHLRDELGWAASELGLSRDSEVLLERLDAHADQLDPADAALIHAHIDPHMQATVAAGRREALAAMRSPRHLALLDALVDAANHPQLTEAAAEPAREALPPLLDKAWRKLRKEVKALTLDGPARQWHETRITAKRARYAAEALAPVFGPQAKALASALSEVTERLGEHQDAAVAQATVRELAGHFDGATGFALGMLHAYEVRCERDARVALHRQWPDVRAVRKRTRLG